MTNLEIYEKVRSVPQEAQKTIVAGRLKGKTDINPMWRIKKLTEVFGPCGFGWHAPITERWIEEGANGEKTANIRINLFVKIDGEWSKPIEGIGGSVLIAKENAGLRTDDDCFKKAYTDAISVACKALGFGGDIYWQKDPTKYDTSPNEAYRPASNSRNRAENTPRTDDKTKVVQPLTKSEMVEKWGVKNVEETVAWFEGKFGAKMSEWTEEETEAARGILEQRKIKRDRETARMREELKNAGEELPFKV